jgi:hypothetical protein
MSFFLQNFFKYFLSEKFRFRFSSGSGSRQYLAQFLNKKLYKIMPFNVRSSIVSRKLASQFRFFDFFTIPFMLDPDPNAIPVLLRRKVPVPVPQH